MRDSVLCALGVIIVSDSQALAGDRFKPMDTGRADKAAQSAGRRRLDPWFWGAAGLFALALAAAAYPVFRTDPMSAPGILLLLDRKSTRLNSSHIPLSRMPSSA